MAETETDRRFEYWLRLELHYSEDELPLGEVVGRFFAASTETAEAILREARRLFQLSHLGLDWPEFELNTSFGIGVPERVLAARSIDAVANGQPPPGFQPPTQDPDAISDLDLKLNALMRSLLFQRWTEQEAAVRAAVEAVSRVETHWSDYSRESELLTEHGFGMMSARSDTNRDNNASDDSRGVLDGDTRDDMAFTKNEQTVIRALAEFDGHSPKTPSQLIEDAVLQLSTRTVQSIYSKLTEVGWLEKPIGPKGGSRLTTSARRQARSMGIIEPA